MIERGFAADVKRSSSPKPVRDSKNCKDEGVGLEKKGQQGEVHPCHPDSKLTQMEQRRGQLGILSDEKRRVSAKTPQLSAFSSVPSPTLNSGKLAPLEIGQHSPRSTSPRLDGRSNSPVSILSGSRPGDSSEKRLSLPTDGSCCPRGTSPRLPVLSPRNDEALPELSPRGGACSARRTRSLSPKHAKRASGTELLSPMRPSALGLSTVPRSTTSEAKHSNSRLESGSAADRALENRGNGPKRGELLFEGRRRESGNSIEANNEPRHRLPASKSHSPLHMRESSRLPEEDAKSMETSWPRNQSNVRRTGRGKNYETRRCSKPSLETLAVMMTRPSSKAEQEPCAMVRASMPARDAVSEEKGGESRAPLLSKGAEDGGGPSPRTRRMQTLGEPA